MLDVVCVNIACRKLHSVKETFMPTVLLTRQGIRRMGWSAFKTAIRVRAIEDIDYKEQYVVVKSDDGNTYILQPEDILRVET